MFHEHDETPWYTVFLMHLSCGGAHSRDRIRATSQHQPVRPSAPSCVRCVPLFPAPRPPRAASRLSRALSVLIDRPALSRCRAVSRSHPQEFVACAVHPTDDRRTAARPASHEGGRGELGSGAGHTQRSKRVLSGGVSSGPQCQCSACHLPSRSLLVVTRHHLVWRFWHNSARASGPPGSAQCTSAVPPTEELGTVWSNDASRVEREPRRTRL